MRLEHWLYTAPLRLRSLFRRNRVESELDEELAFHLELKTEELIAQGLTPAEARRAALRAMGGLTQRKEECRDARQVNGIENTVRDVRHGLRVLAKSPGFTLVAVLTLALAIGANAVVFGILNGFILKPLNVPDSTSLYGLERGKNGYQSYPDYTDLRDQNRSFDQLAAFNINQVALDFGNNPIPTWAYETSGNYFDALRLQPYLGRFFHSSDEHGPNSAPYVVLSYDYWRSHFLDDRSVVGRVVRVNKSPHTILGIAPPEFRGTLLFFAPDIFVPIVNHESVNPVEKLSVRTNHWIFETFGHLKSGVTPAQAKADLDSIGIYLAKTYPKEDAGLSFALARPSLYGNFLGGPVRAFVAGLTLLAALILLAACANLGSLFAARAADRSREVALRLALGASRQRILRQLFTEAILISLGGGALGLVASVALLRWLGSWQPFPRFPVRVPVAPEASVYIVALLLALLSGLLFGLVPVRQVLRADPYQIVKGAATTFGRRLSVRDVLLVVQIAICAVLVTSSMVALRGLKRSLEGKYGFDPTHVMLVNADLNMAGYRGTSVAEVQKRMLDQMQTLPSVESVALADGPPLAMTGATTSVFKEETAERTPSSAAAQPYRYVVSAGYFHVAGTVLLAGRDFTWHDDKDAPRVAVVNREFARQVFGSAEGATGKYFKRWDGTRVQVVGIVEDGKYMTLTEERQPAMFLSILQTPSNLAWVVVRSNGEPEQLASGIRAALHGVDPGIPSYIRTWNNELDGVLFGSRVATVCLGALGLMGAMLSITGIFGMAAYSVSKRLKELGIRMAIGARRQEVLQAALGRAFNLLAIGSAAGVLLGILARSVLASIVYEATPKDPLVLASVVAVMLGLGLIATWIPAQRALALDPVKLLREE